jgi:hypothetical protein
MAGGMAFLLNQSPFGALLRLGIRIWTRVTVALRCSGRLHEGPEMLDFLRLEGRCSVMVRSRGLEPPRLLGATTSR